MKVLFCVNLWHTLVIWDISSHIWWIKKQILGSKFSKNGPQKQKKWENAQKQPILGMFWCIWLTKSVSPEFRRSYKVVFWSFFNFSVFGSIFWELQTQNMLCYFSNVGWNIPNDRFMPQVNKKRNFQIWPKTKLSSLQSNCWLRKHMPMNEWEAL